jgi:hypothetical protein
MSKRLADKDKRTLHRILELAPFPSKTDPEPTMRRTRQQLFNQLVKGWKEQGWHLTRQDIQFCPCRDLQTIDEFWTTHSAGQFGFSVQSEIWRVVYGDVEQFGRIVGWRSNNSWVDYETNIFAAQPDSAYSLNNAPYGHLPVFPLTGWWCWMGGMKSIVDRLACCEALSDRSPGEPSVPFIESHEDRNLFPPSRLVQLDDDQSLRDDLLY